MQVTVRSNVPVELARGEGWPISVSLGAVTFYQADHLMYHVKSRGKNSILQEVVREPPALESPEGAQL